MSQAALLRSAREAVTRYKLRGCAEIGRGVEVHGRICVRGPGRIEIGERVRLDGAAVPIELHAGPGAEIVIEDDVHIDGGASIEAQRSVRIGAGAHLGRFCKILDNHFHRTTDHGDKPSSVPVVVEQGADLGVRSVLLPGAHIGRGAVVGGGTVVARSVPAGAVIAGLPATIRRPG